MDNIFLTCVPLEKACPEAHQYILSAARFLASAEFYGSRDDAESMDMIRADECARDAVRIICGTYPVPLAPARTLVRYAVELHAARLVAGREV